MATLPLASYNVLITLLSPLAFIFTWHQAWRRRGGWAFVVARFGFHSDTSLATPAVPTLWLHAASVGEVKASLPLLTALLDRHPSLHISVTTNTPEAARLLIGQQLPRVRHQYCCIDFRYANRRMLRHIQPFAVLVMETEIWPNLFAQVKQQALPLAIVNARLSKKTLDAPNWVKCHVRQALVNVDKLLARSEQDALAFESLGVAASRITTCGNIKFTQQSVSNAQPLAALENRSYVLAASTHAPEEKIFAEILPQLPSDQLIVIAPRHPARRDEITNTLKSHGIATAVRSQQQPITKQTRVYLADTIGEMDALFYAAHIVFMGGSLATTGGHNLLEPASFGKAIITGPNLHNFTLEAQLLKHAGGLITVANAKALEQTINQLCSDQPLREQMGHAAHTAIQQASGTLQTYLNEIEPLLAPHPSHDRQ